MEKYIFLDFDGVINTPKGKFAKKAVANLLHLVERSDAKIIISSTWRLQGMEYIQKLWQEHHMPGEVIGLTPSCNSINFSNVDGQEEWQGLHGCKGLEIAEWLRLNAKEPFHYIILDDEEDFLFSQREHLVKVEGSKGLDKADVRVAIQIFKYQRDLSNETLVLWCPKIYCGLYPYGDAFHGLFLLVSRKRDEQHESSCPNVQRVFA